MFAGKEQVSWIFPPMETWAVSVRCSAVMAPVSTSPGLSSPKPNHPRNDGVWAYFSHFRDFAAAIDRMEKYSFDEMIYVVSKPTSNIDRVAADSKCPLFSSGWHFLSPCLFFKDGQKSVEPFWAAFPASTHVGTLLGRQVVRNASFALMRFIETYTKFSWVSGVGTCPSAWCGGWKPVVVRWCFWRMCWMKLEPECCATWSSLKVQYFLNVTHWTICVLACLRILSLSTFVSLTDLCLHLLSKSFSLPLVWRCLCNLLKAVERDGNLRLSAQTVHMESMLC